MDTTLTYHSAGNWMRLALKAQAIQQNHDLTNDEGALAFFHEIAMQALSMGFSLRAGNRIYSGMPQLLTALGDNNGELVRLLYRVDADVWCPPSPEKRKRG